MTAESAEAWALLGEEHREVLAALRRLPGRQREALVLRSTRAAAGTVPAGSAPPLRLPRRTAFRSPRWRGRRLPGWVTPAAAAAAVAAAVSVSIAVTVLAGPPARTVGQTGAHGTAQLIPALAHPATVDGLPPFFATASITHDSVTIVSTATGRIVSTVTLPGKPYRIAAGSNGPTVLFSEGRARAASTRAARSCGSAAPGSGC